MQYRILGNTGLQVSQIGFGAWGIGGKSYGAVAEQDAMAALHAAEEMGCNFIDTAAVYGESEKIIGRFLRGRKAQWLVASKYSGQQEGLQATVEKQLRRLHVEAIDFYQLHWVPRGDQARLFETLGELKQAGKLRYIGVSLYSFNDISYVLENQHIDGVQIKFSLLDPEPFLSARTLLADKRPGVLVRSVLREGFLTGKFLGSPSASQSDDMRSEWPPEQQQRLAEEAGRFMDLTGPQRSLRELAIAYALAFNEVSCVLMGCKSVQQVRENMSAPEPLTEMDLWRIQLIQQRLGLLGGWRGYWRKAYRKLLPVPR